MESEMRPIQRHYRYRDAESLVGRSREKMSRRPNGGRERRRHGRGDGVSNRQREERLERGDQARMRQTHSGKETAQGRAGRRRRDTQTGCRRTDKSQRDTEAVGRRDAMGKPALFPLNPGTPASQQVTRPKSSSLPGPALGLSECLSYRAPRSAHPCSALHRSPQGGLWGRTPQLSYPGRTTGKRPNSTLTPSTPSHQKGLLTSRGLISQEVLVIRKV
ncbi:uncharacterized protein [Bos taurus]|uniref:uncharacterized protein isoform X2 n=1 Tax=Bos taurus TaxID=9913 RepID=UPI0028CB88FE|nr:uncharacterized protein LOC132343458 isoform X2 [Bos taurus]